VFFSEEQVADLLVGLEEVRPKLSALQERILTTPFETEGGREHADHGLTRRLGTMARCIENVFALLPPALVDIPGTDVTKDAAINIQAFVVSAFGCCENVAWIWVHERNVLTPKGVLLPAYQVGLGLAYPKVRDSMTPEFRAYLDTREPWFEQLKDYRDALAHRIPLYIPPFTLDPADADSYQALEQQATAALKAHDFDGYAGLKEAKAALTQFRPIMAHSVYALGRTMLFHPQLLADFATIEEMTGVLLDELAR